MTPELAARLAHIPAVRLGAGVEIHPSAVLGPLARLELGDHTSIGPGVRAWGGGELVVGDYAKIHNNTSICAKRHVRLGHCAWIGENTHLDGTGGLTAGDFLGVGIGSGLYSHVRQGDVLEGCNFERDQELVIGHDVCFIGTAHVSPVTCGDKSMALLGAVITRDMLPNHLYAGNPAEDITAKRPLLKPYSAITPERKREMLAGWLDEYFTRVAPPGADRDRARVVTDFPAEPEAGVTYYNVATREYTKTLHPGEVALNRWLFGFRAKFRPRAPAQKETP
jgi:acetyltransferase-like isoleucine patch superfamily enzyme